MAILPWTDSFSVQIEKIDSQHKVLIDYLNRLYDAMLANKGKYILDEIFAGMKIYSVTHFRTEEQLMISSGYPDYEIHKEQHKSFIEKLHQLEADYKTGDKQIVIELTTFLKNWLVTHISNSDKIMGRYLKLKGSI